MFAHRRVDVDRDLIGFGRLRALGVGKHIDMAVAVDVEVRKRGASLGPVHFRPGGIGQALAGLLERRGDFLLGNRRTPLAT